MSKRRNNQAGVALLLVLIVIVAASVLGMSYVSVTTIKVAGSKNLLCGSRARYLAESGLQHAMYILRTAPEVLNGRDASDPMRPDGGDDGNGTYEFYAVRESSNPLVYTLYSKGTFGGVSQRSSSQIELYSTYRDQVMAHGPLSYWRLGEPVGSGVAHDSAGFRNGLYRNGVALGQAGAILGDADGAPSFDGINDYVNLGNMDISGPGNDRLTLLVWFRAEDFATEDARLISKADGTANKDHLWMLGTMQSGASMRLVFRLDCSGSTKSLDASSGNLETGKWIFAAATYDGSKMRIYKDAVEVGQRNQNGNIATDGSVNAWIGNNPSGETSRPFHGLIDEVVILKKCLDENQITSLYNARVASVKILAWSQ